MSAAPIAVEGIRVRELMTEDVDAVVTLLLRGFDDRSEEYWRAGLQRLGDRALPGAYPRYGYGLSAAGRLVGVLLLIFSRADDDSIRANVSSWYVDPDYRLYSAMLVARAMRLREVTLINVSPAPHTLPTISAQGFLPLSAGTMYAVPALAVVRRGVKVARIAPASGIQATIAQSHAALGCLSFLVTYRGQDFQFVFLPRRNRSSGVPFAQLVYCSDVKTFVRFAGALGRQLLRLGYPAVILDANEPVRGLIGHFFAGRKVKYYRGPARPRLGDLSGTELILFGP